MFHRTVVDLSVSARFRGMRQAQRMKETGEKKLMTFLRYEALRFISALLI